MMGVLGRLTAVLLTVFVFSRCLALYSHPEPAQHIDRRSDDHSPLEDVVATQAATIVQLQHRLDTLDTELADLRQRVATDDRVVAFMVSVPGPQNLQHDVHVHYGTPLLNTGQGFNTNTDTFVAPVSGLYVFFLKVTTSTGDWAHYTKFGVKLEGDIIAETEGNDSDNMDRASVQVIVFVAEGQSVWVEKLAGGGNQINGSPNGRESTFGGFLLRAGDSF